MIDLTQFEGYYPEPWRTTPCPSGGVLLYRSGQLLQVVPQLDGELMALAPELLAEVRRWRYGPKTHEMMLMSAIRLIDPFITAERKRNANSTDEPR